MKSNFSWFLFLLPKIYKIKIFLSFNYFRSVIIPLHLSFYYKKFKAVKLKFLIYLCFAPNIRSDHTELIMNLKS